MKKKISTIGPIARPVIPRSTRKNWQATRRKRPEEIRVLDVGTGPGFFAILLAELGYQVTAVDYTASMLDEARRNAGALASRICFRQMNAEELSFEAASFDVVVTRNVTWNLHEPEKAYAQ